MMSTELYITFSVNKENTKTALNMKASFINLIHCLQWGIQGLCLLSIQIISMEFVTKTLSYITFFIWLFSMTETVTATKFLL